MYTIITINGHAKKAVMTLFIVWIIFLLDLEINFISKLLVFQWELTVFLLMQICFLVLFCFLLLLLFFCCFFCFLFFCCCFLLLFFCLFVFFVLFCFVCFFVVVFLFVFFFCYERHFMKSFSRENHADRLSIQLKDTLMIY